VASDDDDELSHLQLLVTAVAVLFFTQTRRRASIFFNLKMFGYFSNERGFSVESSLRRNSSKFLLCKQTMSVSQPREFKKNIDLGSFARRKEAGASFVH